MSESSAAGDIKAHRFYFVSVVLKSGDNLIGPATINAEIDDAVKIDIEDWLFSDYIIMSYPIKIMVDHNNTTNMTLVFSKYSSFSSSNLVFISSDNIQSVNYINTTTSEFYNEARKYLEKYYDTNVETEMQEYTKILKERNSMSAEDIKKNTTEFLKMIIGGNTKPTVH